MLQKQQNIWLGDGIKRLGKSHAASTMKRRATLWTHTMFV